MGVRPDQGPGGAHDPEAVVVLGAGGDLRGGDGGDRAVIQLGEHREVIIERPAGDDRLHAGQEPDRVETGDETDELVGMGPEIAATARGARLAGSTRQEACLALVLSLVASQPWGYHASTLRISPISPSRTSSRASMTIG